MDRRDFLKLLGLAGAAVAVGALPAGTDPLDVQGPVIARGPRPIGGYAMIHDMRPPRFKIDGEKLVRVYPFEVVESVARVNPEYVTAPLEVHCHFLKDTYEVRIEERNRMITI